MKEDSVTISLKKYHQLINAESKIKDRVDEKVNDELKKIKKHNIIIDYDHFYFSKRVHRRILTDSDSIKVLSEKVNEEKEALKTTRKELGEELEKEISQYKDAYLKLKCVKWYNLLFGIEEIKL